MAKRCGLTDAVQDQRGAGRFTGTCRAKQGEVLAQHCIDIEACIDILGRIDLADRDIGAAIACIYLLEVCGGARIDQSARHRITGHTAAKPVNAAGQLLLAAFTEKINIRDDTAFGAAILALVAHAGEQPIVTHADLDLAANLSCKSDRRVSIFHALVQALHVERDLRPGARDFQNYTYGLGGIVLRIMDHIWLIHFCGRPCRRCISRNRWIMPWLLRRSCAGSTGIIGEIMVAHVIHGRELSSARYLT